MLTIRPIEARDIPACLTIYNYYIENTTITFEEEPLTPEAFSARVSRIQEHYPYLVAEEDGAAMRISTPITSAPPIAIPPICRSIWRTAAWGAALVRSC